MWKYKHKKIEVACKDCHKKWLKRFDTISTWQNRCGSCSQSLIHSRPKYKRISSINGKKVMAKYNNHLPNARIFTSEMVKGEKSNFWKGGITSENRRIRGSKQYFDWRTAVFTRDNYTCQICGQRGGNLHSDHIKQFAFFPELRFDLNNGRTLCKECHMETPTYRQRTLIAKIT